MSSAIEISPEKLYEDAKRFNDLCRKSQSAKAATQEFENSTDYLTVGRGKYRSAFYIENLHGENNTVIKFPNRVYRPEEGNQHNIDEYKAWESMDDQMRDDFAEVLGCGDEGEYLVQRKSDENSLFGALKLIMKYRYSDYPSEDLKPANIGIVSGRSVILDFPWGQLE